MSLKDKVRFWIYLTLFVIISAACALALNVMFFLVISRFQPLLILAVVVIIFLPALPMIKVVSSGRKNLNEENFLTISALAIIIACATPYGIEMLIRYIDPPPMPGYEFDGIFEAFQMLTSGIFVILELVYFFTYCWYSKKRAKN